MADNQDLLDSLYQQITGVEIIEKINNGAQVWSKVGTTQYSTSFQTNVGTTYDLYVDVTNGLVNLDILKGGRLYFNLKSDDVPQLVDLYETLTVEDNAAKDREVLDVIKSATFTP